MHSFDVRPPAEAKLIPSYDSSIRGGGVDSSANGFRVDSSTNLRAETKSGSQNGMYPDALDFARQLDI